MKNKISDFRIVNKRIELFITIAGKQNRDLPLQYKHGNGAGSCDIHGTSPSSAKAVDVIGSGKWMCQGVMVPMGKVKMEKMVMEPWW